MRHYGSADSIGSAREKTSAGHNNLNVFSILVASLVFGLFQTGCIGLTGSNKTNPPANTPALTVSSNSLSFGNVSVGSSGVQNLTLTNSGTATLTVSNETSSGTGFSIVGGSKSISIAAGQSSTIQAQFAPQATGSATGSLTIASNDPTSPATVALTGNGAQALISFTPNSITFGNVSVGGSSSQAVTISNNGTMPLTISSISAVGSGYTMSGMSAPVTINAGASAPFTAKFAPILAGNSTGGVSVNSNAPHPPQTIAFTGMGVATSSVLNANPTSVAFGNVNVGSSSSQNISLSNTGTANITISQIGTTGTGFSSSGITVPITLTPGQSATLAAKYSPASAGNGSGTITVTSNASNPSLTIALTGAGVQTAPQIVANPTSVAFGSIAIGGSSSQTITLSNTGNATLTISQITPSGTGYSVSGFTLPVSIAAGASSPITATFTPASAGSPAGNISITSNAPTSPTNIAMTGTGLQSALTANPTSISFGNVTVGSSGSQTVTLNNTGTSALSVSAITASGAGYSVSGFTLPIAIAAGASSTFTAKFTPAASGLVSGNVSVTSNAPGSPLTIAMTGTGAQGQVTPSPASVAFGNVLVGASSSQTISLTNNGTASVTISQATVSGTGFSISGLTLPLTLTAAQSTTFTATFTPSSAAAVAGSIAITSNGSNPNLTIPMTGTGTAPLITTSPATVGFGSVTIGSPNSQTIRINNTGTAPLTISQATVTGTGFAISGLTVPANIAAGGNTTFNVTFAPNSAGAVSGSISLTNNSATSPLSIPLTGTGVAATLLLNASTSSLSFGNVNVGSNSTLTVTLTNAGNSSVTISTVTTTGTGYTSSGVVAAQSIAAGATATLSVKFTPTVAGLVSGNVAVASNATNSPINVALSGTGVQAVQHSVTLSWTASTSTVSGYNVYRSTTSGGPYTLLTSTLVAGTTYTDSTVQAGVTYFYVVTAVDANGSQSVNSNEASAAVPTP
jgi:hypothetical protein